MRERRKPEMRWGWRWQAGPRDMFVVVVVFKYSLFIWLCWVLVAARGNFIAACGIFSCSLREIFFSVAACGI